MKKKRHFLFIIALLCSVIGTQAQSKLGENSLKVNEYKTINLNSTYKNVLSQAGSVSYRWYSSNTSISTVSYSSFQSCTVTGKAEGTCRVYFTASFNVGGRYDTYNFYWDITVSGFTGGGTIVDPTSAITVPTELTLHVGETYQMGFTVYPLNANYYTKEWAIYQKNIATINPETGIVTAISPGTAIIYLWIENKSRTNTFATTCVLTVLPREETLDENSMEVPTAADYVNITVNRTLIANEWNTICLPFAMTISQLTDAFGEDVQLGEFDGCEIEEDLDAGVKTIKVGFSDAAALEANHPYIIKVGEDVTSFTVNNVNVVPSDNPVLNRDELVIDDCDGTVTLYNQFVGTYVANTIVPAGAYFLSGNKFYRSKGKTPMGAFRGYFVFNNTTGNNGNSEAKIFLTFNEDGVFSGIECLEQEVSKPFTSSSYEIYTLDGRRVTSFNGNLLSKGIYIINGKKTIVK